jgi:hypothetical protein
MSTSERPPDQTSFVLIERDEDYRRKLLDDQKSRMGIGIRRVGLHVSDLVFCARKAWAERVTEFAADVDDGTVLTFLRGLSHEGLLEESLNQVRSGYCFPCNTNYAIDARLAETQRCPACNDTLLVGTIDWVTLDPDNSDYIPVEMKSTLKSSRKRLAQDMPWYIDQLMSYLYMHGRDEGRICILHVMGNYARGNQDERGGGPRAELIVYKVRWRSSYARQRWGEILYRRKLKVEGLNKPALDEDSPVHDYICEYCVIGERLPDGTECERFPWVRQSDGRYLKKGSKTLERSNIDDMLRELESIKEGLRNAGREGAESGAEGGTEGGAEGSTNNGN